MFSYKHEAHLVLVCTPPPQVTVQSPYSVHSPQQFTGAWHDWVSVSDPGHPPTPGVPFKQVLVRLCGIRLLCSFTRSEQYTENQAGSLGFMVSSRTGITIKTILRNWIPRNQNFVLDVTSSLITTHFNKSNIYSKSKETIVLFHTGL